MNDLNNIAKLVLFKKKYINDLCVYYGSPREVRDHLQFIAGKHRILSGFLRNDIAQFTKEDEEECQVNYSAIETQNGCCNCPWGNGEGGCTIPGYCT